MTQYAKYPQAKGCVFGCSGEFPTKTLLAWLLQLSAQLRKLLAQSFGLQQQQSITVVENQFNDNDNDNNYRAAIVVSQARGFLFDVCCATRRAMPRTPTPVLHTPRSKRTPPIEEYAATRGDLR